MLCEKCRKRDASVHLTEIIKNVKSEIHLCDSCAREFGLNSKLSNFSLTVPEMLTFLDVEEIGNVEEVNICMSCGLSYLEYRKTGQLGCPNCYRYMKEPLAAVVSGFHGAERHVGKVPMNYIDVNTAETRLIEGDRTLMMKEKDREELERDLQRAVREERFEEAAGLRDRLRKLEMQEPGKP